jgi:hypothetical protein
VDALEEALCGVMFNAMGYLHELLKRRSDQSQSEVFAKAVRCATHVGCTGSLPPLEAEGLTDEPLSANLKRFDQRRSPWWPEERFGNG